MRLPLKDTGDVAAAVRVSVPLLGEVTAPMVHVTVTGSEDWPGASVTEVGFTEHALTTPVRATLRENADADV